MPVSDNHKAGTAATGRKPLFLQGSHLGKLSILMQDNDNKGATLVGDIWGSEWKTPPRRDGHASFPIALQDHDYPISCISLDIQRNCPSCLSKNKERKERKMSNSLEMSLDSIVLVIQAI
ncbi:hypothetical protein BVC80_8771g28 [Macleaya cordata]|uniref:Uncharacterized protein n=1 Tax=Macleaya cordata TaxID=56857 RepID=A0A200QSI1_MACCD|nr:hypothetical protein BVC80_8771g28 [Macleaya cordata]